MPPRAEDDPQIVHNSAAPEMGSKEGNTALDPAEIRLRELGYKQELKRDLSLFEIASVSAAVMNPFITVIPFYSIALGYGGPQNMMWPWWPVVLFTVIVGLNLAEICSSYPYGPAFILLGAYCFSGVQTTGSLYFWAASMCPPKWTSLVSWMTAWLEVVALVVGNASVAFPAAQLIQIIIFMATGGPAGGGYFASKTVLFFIFAGIEFLWALMNSVSTRFVSYFLNGYVYFQTLYMVTFVVVLLWVAPSLQAPDYVFFHYEDSVAVTGVSSPFQNFMFATLLPQFCFFGYDAAAHVTEETRNADIAGPRAIMLSIIIEVITGYTVIAVLTFAIQGYWGDLYNPMNQSGGQYPVAQILYDVFNNRFQNATGAYIILVLMIIPFLAAGAGGALAASRAVFAFSRDNAMPLSFLWRKVTKKEKIPLNASWLVAFVASCFGLPVFGSNVAFLAIVSVATIAWVGTYAVPIFFRLTMREEDFKPGPFSLGRWSKPMCAISLLYILYTMAIFMAPNLYPVTVANLNYGPIAFCSVMFLAFMWWLIDARKWFKGPVRTVDSSMHGGM